MRRTIAIMLIACLTVPSLGWPAAAQSGRVNCSSDDMKYHYCRVDTGNYARIVRQISGSPCQQDYSWGYDARGIWVDRGCRAEFEFGGGNSGGGGDDHRGRNAAIAAGIIGALVVGAAVSSRGNRDDRDNADTDGAQRREYYNDGYRLGQKDYDDGGAANVSIWSNSRKIPSRYEGDFDAGYDDGYNNRRRRY